MKTGTTATLFFLLSFLLNLNAQVNTDLLKKFRNDRTVTYEEAISFYKDLAEGYEEAEILEYGRTDVGKPLHLFLISSQKAFKPKELADQDLRFLLINNAIHPGEPCGVDASMKFAFDLLQQPDRLKEYTSNTVIGIIPVYNVGGTLNRNCCTRVNQNGPKMHGFRGNGRNLDLNRDFVKCDSRNAITFTRIFQIWDPDIFIDTHSTNGADYQHVMTLINTQRDKLHPMVSEFMTGKMLPYLYDDMEKKDFPMCPYVYTMGRTPEDGLREYLETPRYSTGYAALFNTIGFVSETHMLKDYEQRVQSTYAFLNTTLEFTNENAPRIGEVRRKADKAIMEQDSFALRWELDTTKVDSVLFMGYEAKTKKSNLTGSDHLYYDQEEPWTDSIPFYNHYKATVKLSKPEYYIIPQAWRHVIQRLETNRVKMERLEKDTTIRVTAYYIRDHSTIDRPYEGHYYHNEVSVEPVTQEWEYHTGDVLVPTGQTRDRYIVKTLEPEGMDSFFAWNFFDEILMQKEYFSSYLFEPKAEKILEEDPEIREAFEKKKNNDPEFAKKKRAQLDFIYKRSKHYEDTHLRYPVVRLQ